MRKFIGYSIFIIGWILFLFSNTDLIPLGISLLILGLYFIIAGALILLENKRKEYYVNEVIELKEIDGIWQI